MKFQYQPLNPLKPTFSSQSNRPAQRCRMKSCNYFLEAPDDVAIQHFNARHVLLDVQGRMDMAISEVFNNDGVPKI